MPWLDQIIVLQEGRLIQNDNAEETYNHPYNEYVAELFGEVNVFSGEEKLSFGLSKILFYPHEIKISKEGKVAQVLESRFAGSYFWNKVSLEGKNLIFYTSEKIDGSVKISFD